MQTLTHFKNQPKSEWAEEQIKNNLEAVDRILPNSGLIHAEIILEPNDEQTVHLDMNSPRLFEAHVAITDKNLMNAIHDATDKFVRMLKRRKSKIKDASRKQPSALKTMPIVDESEQDSIDAGTLLKLEDRRQKLLKQINSTEKTTTKSQNTELHARLAESKNMAPTPEVATFKETFLLGIEGIGQAKCQKILSIYPDDSLDDINAAVWNKTLRKVPGIGRTIEKRILKALMADSLHYSSEFKMLDKPLPFYSITRH